jgi:hypothetical protein
MREANLPTLSSLALQTPKAMLRLLFLGNMLMSSNLPPSQGAKPHLPELPPSSTQHS